MKLIKFTATLLIAFSVKASAATVLFDNYLSPSNNDLANNFTVNGSASYSQVTSGGITGGAVNITGSDFGTQSVIYDTPYAQPTGSTNSNSLFFKLNSTAFSGPTVRLGWLASQTTPIHINSNTYFWVEPYNNTSIALHMNDGATFTHPITQTIAPMTAGHWYKLSLDISSLGGTQFLTQIALQDFGTNGLSASTVLYSGSATVTNSAAASDTTWYSGFFGGASSGSDLIDNVTIIPEPSSSALLLLGLGMLGRRYRKRGSQHKPS